MSTKYLGLPTEIGANRKEKFWYIVERVQKRLMGWKERFLSFGGKEVLIKAVIQAIPTYSMQCFKLPQGLCYQLARLANNFLWGSTGEKRKIHWMAWRRMAKPKGTGGVGFRDFEFFNQSLLAKQGWRILQNPHSLCTQLLKARYFPHDDFLQAKLGRAPSYTWRSILYGREALKEGLIWRVGNGESIKVWEDKWVATNQSGKVTSPANGSTIERVSELIDAPNRCWNKDLIAATFEAREAGLICQIPLAQNPTSDLRAWKLEVSGLFSVRSLYRHLVAYNETDGQQIESLWKAIWKASVPSKINFFMWRLAQEILPSYTQLNARRLDLNTTCFRCQDAAETCMHAIRDCSSTNMVWVELQQRGVIQPFSNPGSALRTWLEDNLVGRSESYKAIFSIACWSLWNERNNALRGEPIREAKLHADHILRFHEEFNRAREMGRVRPEHQAHDVTLSWRRPTHGWVKLNTDAATDRHQGRIGLGCIIRDENGNCIGGCAKHIEGDDVLMGEALALKEGLQLARQNGFAKVHAETDSQQLVNLTNSNFGFMSAIGAVLRDINELSFSFSHFELSFVPREINVYAHQCAKYGLHVADVVYWQEHTPNEILSFLNCTNSRRDE